MESTILRREQATEGKLQVVDPTNQQPLQQDPKHGLSQSMKRHQIKINYHLGLGVLPPRVERRPNAACPGMGMRENEWLSCRK